MIREVPESSGLLPGSFDTYDLYTIIFLIAALIAIMTLVIYILGLPGKIAISRRHPHAEEVKLMGWVGALAVVPWIHAFLWAYHDSLTIDIRRFPKDEEKAIDEEIARLKGETGKDIKVVKNEPEPPAGDATPDTDAKT